MAIAQAGLAAERLDRADGSAGAEAVHEARKAIKRTRAIVRLLEAELGPEKSAREQARLKAAAAGLAGARDAEVLLATLEDLTRRHRKKLAGRKGVARLRRRLSTERDAAEREMLQPANRLRVASELRAFSARATDWQLSGRAGIDSVEPGLRSVYTAGRRRMGKASGKRGARTRTMHQWRKRVKDIRYAAAALQRDAPAGSGHRRRARSQAKERRWLTDLAKRADRLGEVLGDEHDLAVLDEWISMHGPSAGAGRATRRKLRKLITSRRAKLRRRALRQGAAFYRRKPGKFIARLAHAYSRLS